MNETHSIVKKRPSIRRFGEKPKVKGPKINRNPGGYNPSDRTRTHRSRYGFIRSGAGRLRVASVRLAFLILGAAQLWGQNIPDRIIHLDPLGDTTVPSDRFVPLPAARLFAEFARFSNGSGENHRWDARTGGYLEFARFSGDWSISIHGTMEVVMDPLNDIEFNPRAIFWEEGLLIATRGPIDQSSVQFGYTHRCKHDIDNYEVFATRGEREQRTLIFSGPFVRLLRRPTPLARIGNVGDLTLGGALRADYYVHLLDDRSYTERPGDSGSIEDLVASSSLSARVGLDFDGSIVGLHLSGALQSSLRSGPSSSDGLDLLMSWAELALDLRNPTGMTFSIYARTENQRDGGILVEPTPATLLSIGVRGAGVGMW